MKTTLKISLVINLSLLAALVCFWPARHREVPPTKMSPGQTTGSPAPVAVVAAPPEAMPAKPPAFHWSQLEASDYRTYVKNLRGIGCPEATLRAIVTADMNSKYGARSDELGEKLSDFDQRSWSEKLGLLHSREAWLEKLRQIPEEKAAEIASLLGSQRAPADQAAMVSGVAAPAQAGPRANPTSSTLFQAKAASAQSPTTVSLRPAKAKASLTEGASASLVFQSRSASQASPVYPMVFQEVDLTALNFNAQQIQAIDDLRQTFVDEIGGPNQDPSSPDYLERWLKAQTDVDNLAKGLLGIMPWQTYQIAIRNQSQQ